MKHKLTKEGEKDREIFAICDSAKKRLIYIGCFVFVMICNCINISQNNYSLVPTIELNQKIAPVQQFDQQCVSSDDDTYCLELFIVLLLALMIVCLFGTIALQIIFDKHLSFHFNNKLIKIIYTVSIGLTLVIAKVSGISLHDFADAIKILLGNY